MKRFNIVAKTGACRSVLLYIAFGIALLAFFYYIGPIWTGFTTILSVISPLFYGIIIAFVLNILMSFLERTLFDRMFLNAKGRKAKLKRPLALVATLIIAFGFFTLIFAIVLPKFIESIVSLVEAFPAYWEAFVAWSSQFFTIDELVAFINERWAEYGNEISTKVINALQDALPHIFGFTASIASGIANIVFGFIFAMYMLFGKERLQKQLTDIIAAFTPERVQKGIRYVASVTNTSFHNFVSGQCIEAMILGVLTYIGALILQLPYALILGVLVGVTSVIPVLGAFLGAIPCVVLLVIIDPIKALIFVIFIIILQQIEGNLIYPRVVGNSVGLSGLWVMLAVIVGSGLMGIGGILLAVPLFATVGTLLTEKVARTLAEKKTDPGNEGTEPS